MATYCMSDIHGHYNSFMRILDGISLSEDDHVYVLGDVIDRGPDVASLLVACVELNKLDNFHFLLGNHEHMAYQYLLRSHSFSNEDERNHWIDKVHGSKKTLDALDLMDPDWMSAELIPWFDNLLYYDVAEVGGQQWMLVHAGFNPKRYGNLVKEHPDDVLVDKRFGVQSLSDLIWIREEWMYDGQDAPMPVIHGHTPTDYFSDKLDLLDAKVGEGVYLSNGGILYYKNKIDIDCGAGNGVGLGCLRLDDFEEFHSSVRKYD